MPSVEENQQTWDANYDWFKQGEEWSSEWGGSESQWYGSILPRIHRHLPAGRILEIAPGYGRWTNYLKNYCSELVAVDMAETCVRACRQRFVLDKHLTFHVNDGRSLAMIPSNSIDFIFSFDCLVHAECEVMEGYVNELPRILRADGVGFVHHSNLGQHERELAAIQRVPDESREQVFKKQYHWRATTMTAERFANYCEKADLQCVSQELVNWGTEHLLIDCFSLFTPKGSKWSKPNRVFENPEFMKEARMIKSRSSLYLG